MKKKIVDLVPPENTTILYFDLDPTLCVYIFLWRPLNEKQ